jgi:hypothetical protein
VTEVGGAAPDGIWGGVVAMDAQRYGVLAHLAGAALLELRPYPVPVNEASGDERKAVYVGVNRGGYACYAGQTRPPTVITNAAGRRVGQHMQDPSKREEWREYWTFPLVEDTDAHHVDQFERAICARLGLPLRNRRWRRHRSFGRSTE